MFLNIKLKLKRARRLQINSKSKHIFKICKVCVCLWWFNIYWKLIRFQFFIFICILPFWLFFYLQWHFFFNISFHNIQISIFIFHGSLFIRFFSVTQKISMTKNISDYSTEIFLYFSYSLLACSSSRVKFWNASWNWINSKIVCTLLCQLS